jgi:hypothetical protein
VESIAWTGRLEDVGGDVYPTLDKTHTYEVCLLAYHGIPASCCGNDASAATSISISAGGWLACMSVCMYGCGVTSRHGVTKVTANATETQVAARSRDPSITEPKSESPVRIETGLNP